MKKLKKIYGVIGSNGYLGSQLKKFNSDNSLKNNTLIAYNRSRKKFNIKIPENINLLINFASPNEVVCRSNTKLDEIFMEWKKTIDNAIDSAKPSTLINISTTHVFNTKYKVIDEFSSFGSKDPYAIMQIKCIKYLDMKCKTKKIRLLHLFTSNIYGSVNKNIKMRKNLVLNNTIISALSKQNLILNSDCNIHRDFIWIEDFLIILGAIIEDVKKIRFKKIIIASGKMINVKKSILTLFSHLKLEKKQKILFGKKVTSKGNLFSYNNERLLKVVDLKILKSNFKTIDQAAKKLYIIYK